MTSKLKRHTAIKRSTGLPQARKEPRRPALWTMREVGWGDDPEFMDRVRQLPCCARFLPGHRCSGPPVAHHAGRHGGGVKCPDWECIPLSDQCHRDIHETKGPFENWTRWQVRDWEDARIRETQAILNYQAPKGDS